MESEYTVKEPDKKNIKLGKSHFLDQIIYHVQREKLHNSWAWKEDIIKTYVYSI